MKLLSLFFSVIIFLSCNDNLQVEHTKVKQPNVVEEVNTDTDSLIVDLLEYPDLATYYIVCIDSGKNYYSLDSDMYKYESMYNIAIDTANRAYDSNKDLIALPLNADDEMYAGAYYPRRYPSTHLSLEYLYIYDDNINEKTIGLIAGIYENKEQADSLLKTFKPMNSFVIKGKVYVGCMH